MTTLPTTLTQILDLLKLLEEHANVTTRIIEKHHEAIDKLIQIHACPTHTHPNPQEPAK